MGRLHRLLLTQRAYVRGPYVEAYIRTCSIAIAVDCYTIHTIEVTSAIIIHLDPCFTSVSFLERLSAFIQSEVVHRSQVYGGRRRRFVLPTDY
jgi:hypothetical protein